MAVATIALGAAALTSSLVLGASLRTAINTGLTIQYAGVDIVDNAGVATAQDSVGTAGTPAQGFDARDQRKIAQIDGVEAYGTSFRTVAVAQVGSVTRGVTLDSLNSHQPFRWQAWSAGRAPQAVDEIALSGYTLGQLKIRFGDRVAITQPALGRFSFRVVGVVDTRGALQYQSTMYGVVSGKVARSLSGLDAPNSLLIEAEPGADDDELIAAINAVAPRGLPQSTADIMNADKSLAITQINAMNAVVSGLAAVSSLVAAVTAMTTAGASLARRRRGWALLRCVGADRRYVAWMVTGEALVVGLLGGLLGMVLGLGLARTAVPVVGLVPGLPALKPEYFTVPAYALYVPLGVAVLLAAAGAVVPAWLAARVPPSAALQPTVSSAGAPSTTRMLAALGLTVAGVVATFIALDLRIVWLGAVGTISLLAGFGMLLIYALMWTASAFIAAMTVTDQRLGLLDVVRRPRAAVIEAAAVTLAVLMITISVVTLSSVKQATSARLDESTAADLKIGLVTGSPIPAATIKELADVPGVQEAVPVQFGADVSIRGRGPDGRVLLTTGTAGGDTGTLGSALPDGLPVPEVRDDTVYIVKSAFPPFYKGRTVTLTGPRGRVQDLRVKYVEDLQTPTLVSRATLERVADTITPNEVWLRLAAGADRAEVVDTVTGIAILGGDLQVSGTTILDLRVESAFDTARAAAVAILAIAVLVAVIGAAATAALSVNERARTHAMLRAIGLPRARLRRLLATRLTLVAAVAALFGVLIGAVLGVAAGQAIAHSLGLAPRVDLPVLPILVVVVLTVLAVRVAALVPVERASYTPPSQALSQA